MTLPLPARSELGLSEMTLPVGRGGIVATAHPLATQAGVSVLERGGNAMDAAIAAAAVLGVAQPMMSGLGGDSFVLFHDARSGLTHSIQGAGPAPHALADVVCRNGEPLPERGLLSAAVPGAVSAMCAAFERFAGGRLNLAQLLEPAVQCAEHGTPVAHWVARFFQRNEALLQRSETTRTALLSGGVAPREGDVLRQPALARTLRMLGEHGPEAFYAGEFAKRLVAYSQAMGGAFRLQDLQDFRAEVVPPLALKWGRWTVLTNPPVGQGIVLLEALGILERVRARGGVEDPALRIHRMAECLKLGFADRNAFLGDPKFTDNPIDRLLSATHLEQRACQVDDVRAIAACPDPRFGDGDTTCLAVADRHGNLAAYITSLSTPFGAAVVVPGTGVLLNNRAGRGFSPNPSSPNGLEGGKRTMSTLHVYAVFDGARPVLAGGCSGGDGQPQWNLQILDAVLNQGLTVQEAVDMPRWELFPGSDPGNLGGPYELRLDSRLKTEMGASLEQLGHRLSDEPLGMLGAAQVVSLDAEGMYTGAADPRADGTCLAID